MTAFQGWRAALFFVGRFAALVAALHHADHAVCHSGRAFVFLRRPPVIRHDGIEELAMAVDPTGTDLARLLEEDPGGPVVMLNLLRFAPDGRSSYAEYSRRAHRILQKYGAELIYAGDGGTPLVAGEGQAWDAVLLVRYPSREAFTRMIADPEYQQITKLRTRALSGTVLQPTVPWSQRNP